MGVMDFDGSRPSTLSFQNSTGSMRTGRASAIITVSIGTPIAVDLLDEAIDKLFDKGFVVVWQRETMP